MATQQQNVTYAQVHTNSNRNIDNAKENQDIYTLKAVVESENDEEKNDVTSEEIKNGKKELRHFVTFGSDEEYHSAEDLLSISREVEVSVDKTNKSDSELEQCKVLKYNIPDKCGSPDKEGQTVTSDGRDEKQVVSQGHDDDGGVKKQEVVDKNEDGGKMKEPMTVKKGDETDSDGHAEASEEKSKEMVTFESQEAVTKESNKATKEKLKSKEGLTLKLSEEDVAKESDGKMTVKKVEVSDEHVSDGCDEATEKSKSKESDTKKVQTTGEGKYSKLGSGHCDSKSYACFYCEETFYSTKLLRFHLDEFHPFKPSSEETDEGDEATGKQSPDSSSVEVTKTVLTIKDLPTRRRNESRGQFMCRLAQELKNRDSWNLKNVTMSATDTTCSETSTSTSRDDLSNGSEDESVM